MLIMCSPFANNRAVAGVPRGVRVPVVPTLVGASRGRELRGTPLFVTAPMPGTESAEPVELPVVRPEDPRPLDRRRLPPQDPSPMLPTAQRVDRHPELARQVAQPPLMTAKLLALDPLDGSRSQPAQSSQKLIDHEPVELSRDPRRTKSLLIEPLGDLGAGGTAFPQLDHTIAEGFIIAELLIFLHRTSDLVPRLQAAEPANRGVDPLRLPPDRHRDSFHQAADDRLPILDRRAGAVPHLRQV